MEGKAAESFLKTVEKLEGHVSRTVDALKEGKNYMASEHNALVRICTNFVHFRAIVFGEELSSTLENMVKNDEDYTDLEKRDIIQLLNDNLDLAVSAYREFLKHAPTSLPNVSSSADKGIKSDNGGSGGRGGKNIHFWRFHAWISG